MWMVGEKALWGSQQNLLREVLAKQDQFDAAIQLCLEQHAMVHTSEMSQINAVTFEDELWRGLGEAAFRARPGAKDSTIAWNLWHVTRIEDITVNILIADEAQVMNTNQWLQKLNVTVCDTGNAMTEEEIADLSSVIDMQELYKYRVAVGRKTREVIQKLQTADLKRKVAPEGLQRILAEGAVLDVEGANWLIDFWGRKNVAGILLMPVTRHLMVHMNEAMRIKARCGALRGKK